MSLWKKIEGTVDSESVTEYAAKLRNVVTSTDYLFTRVVKKFAAKLRKLDAGSFNVSS